MAIPFLRINHFHVCVDPGRLEEARLFYTDVLGLVQIERPDHLFDSPGYWFNIGDAQLHIGVEAPGQFTERHTAIEVEDIEVARQQLEANGIEIHPQPKVPGWERFAFIDPFGNRMELLQVTG